MFNSDEPDFQRIWHISKFISCISLTLYLAFSFNHDCVTGVRIISSILSLIYLFGLVLWVAEEVTRHKVGLQRLKHLYSVLLKGNYSKNKAKSIYYSLLSAVLVLKALIPVLLGVLGGVFL